ncbi:hypothetical protein [Caulobacter sp. 17J65-9]|uniref:hypothetical protein n=1 Tax=Caulobacter sp. 17J65-9 TaxID=2709382 RepID=UPI0013C549D2|nr:hypothetical protein [Caulobacter sp. 17J65-9]NEX94698.1 hypothetical protein [Caulobacter sp. 17J65-9]
MPNRQKQGGKGQQRGQAQGQRTEAQAQSDLKAREYRDDKGQVHHHTQSYMDQHKGERGDRNR